MATKDQKKVDAQANATEPNEGVTHDATSDAPDNAGAGQAQSAKSDSGVPVKFGKYLRELGSTAVTIGGERFVEGDKVSESFFDSNENKTPTGGKYLTKGGDA